MISLKEVILKNFRSYSDSSIKFEKKLNIIIGPNGAGKTNIAEAIYFVATGESFRTPQTKNLVRKSEQCARITEKISYQNKIISESEEIPQIKREQRILKTVVFSPELINIISDEPEKRRGFLDSIIIQYDKQYYSTLLKYKKLTKQRAEAIKKGAKAQELKIWNERYAKYSENITSKRVKLVTKINELISANYQQISGQREKIAFDFQTRPKKITAAEIIKRLETEFETERILGYTTCGAKSDDIKIQINSEAAKSDASYGEKWSIMLAAVLSIHQILTESAENFFNTEPLLILDDVFAGIDETRCKKVVELIKGFNQTIITSADEKKIPKTAQYFAIHLEKPAQ